MNIAPFICLTLLVPAAPQAEWSVFDPISEAAPPRVENADWSAPLDAFIYAKLQESQLEPAPIVDRTTWIRRVTYDLVGLPPELADVGNFLDDPRPDLDAMEDVVDRLLASPRYGERWGRHWLDVVRYADFDGFAIDEERLSLWRYRDYVIRVFNEDQPFDQFIRYQIAGDELEAGDAGKIAISFYRLGPWEADNMVKQQRRQDYLNDVTSAIGSIFLGLSVGCARCHDHKFDPVLQTDYYRLQAFISPIQRDSLSAEFLPDEMHSAIKQRVDGIVGERLGKINTRRAELKTKIADARKVPVGDVSDEELDKAIQEKTAPITDGDASKLNELMSGDSLKPEQRYEPKVVAIRNPKGDEKISETFVLENGDVFSPADKVSPGFLSSAPICSEELISKAAASDASGGGRRKSDGSSDGRTGR